MQDSTFPRQRCRPAWWLGAAALAWSTTAAAQGVAGCVMEADNQLRLACYDRLFREPKPQAPPAKPVAAAPTEPAQPADRAEALLVATAFTKAWELTPEAKRGTFVVRTYLPNFILPLHTTSSINRTPSSPTRNFCAMSASLA